MCEQVVDWEFHSRVLCWRTPCQMLETLRIETVDLAHFGCTIFPMKYATGFQLEHQCPRVLCSFWLDFTGSFASSFILFALSRCTACVFEPGDSGSRLKVLTRIPQHFVLSNIHPFWAFMWEEMDWTTWNPEALWNEAWKVHTWDLVRVGSIFVAREWQPLVPPWGCSICSPWQLVGSAWVHSSAQFWSEISPKEFLLDYCTMLPHSKDYSPEVSLMQPEQENMLRIRDWPSVALVHAKL